MTMLLSNDDLATITFKSPFIYEYGDMPYFKRCINEFPLKFFARYRTNKVDPSQHRWSRIVEVVDRHVNNIRGDNNNNNIDSMCVTADPIKWKDKYFFIALRIEGEEKWVELPRLSSKLPSEEEVMQYCARRVESLLQNGKDNNDMNMEVDGVNEFTAREQLPSVHEITKMKGFRHNYIINHKWTSEEVEEVRQRNERIGRVGAGSAPVRLTVTSVHNMRLETELGIASSRHAIGHSATVMERRSQNLLALNSQTNSPASQINSAESQSLLNTTTSFASLHSLTPTCTPISSSPLFSSEMVKRWEESKRDAENFYAYVSNEDRSAYLTKIVSITQKNYEQNKRDRLRGIANEKRLYERGNLPESSGLWIVDDQMRAELALKYRMEQDSEMVVSVGNETSKNTSTTQKKKDTELQSNTETSLIQEEEDMMLQRFITQHKTHELSFASVPDEFMSIGNDEDNVHEDSSFTQRESFFSQSPEMLVTHSNPQVVASQLLHKVASGILKRVSLSSSSSPAYYCNPSRNDMNTLGDEPAKKIMRHV